MRLFLIVAAHRFESVAVVRTITGLRPATNSQPSMSRPTSVRSTMKRPLFIRRPMLRKRQLRMTIGRSFGTATRIAELQNFVNVRP